jgi:DNA-directed RNA polymerase subunit H (RpoH/RPB5)
MSAPPTVSLGAYRGVPLPSVDRDTFEVSEDQVITPDMAAAIAGATSLFPADLRDRAARELPAFDAPPAPEAVPAGETKARPDVAHDYIDPAVFVVVSTLWEHYMPFRKLTPIPTPARGAPVNESKSADVEDVETKAVAPPTRDSVLREITVRNHVRLDARRATSRGARDRVVILVLDNNYSGPKLQTLLNAAFAPPRAKDSKDDLDEVMLVVYGFSGKKNLLTVVSTRLKELATDADPDGTTARLNVYPYEHFVRNLPKHVGVNMGRVLTEKEAEKVLQSLRKAPRNIPFVPADNAICSWHGAREGQIIEISATSETSACTVRWKLVKAPEYLAAVR